VTVDPTPGGLRARLRVGEPLMGTFLGLGSPLGAEVVASAGFDWVLFDLEHGAGGETSLLTELQAVTGTGVPAVVRVESDERIRTGRVLDLGADGIMFPRVESGAMAVAAARHLRYPPEGDRGLAFGVRRHGFVASGEEGLARTNAEVVGIVQIESAAAVEDIDAIAAADGVDVLFVGPSDLSQSLGILGQLEHPSFLDALERVQAAARASGRGLGAYVPSLDVMEAWLGRGFTLFAIGQDVGFLADGARGTAEEARRRARSG
jgi:4-hydroxy-2-oxoheptanedioate aldolase